MRSLSNSLLFLAWSILAFTASAQDTIKDARVTIADSLLESGNYENAISLYTEFFNSSGKNMEGKEAQKAECATNIGLCYYYLNKYEDAIGWFRKAGYIQLKLNDDEGYANSLNNIGISYKLLGEYEKAIDYYQQTVKIDEELGNSNDIAKTYNNIGMIYRAWGKYDKAISYFDMSYQIRKGSDDKPGMSKSLNSMGLVYSEWKKYGQALDIFRESLAIEESLENEAEVAIRLNNIGRLYFYMKQYDSALVYFERSLKINDKNNDIDQVALGYNNLGKVYLEKKQLKEANFYLHSALEIFSKLGMEAERSTVLANLGSISNAMDKSGEALVMLDSSTRIAEKMNLANQLKQNYLYYSDIYSNLKSYEKSLEYYKKYTDLKDTMFNKEILSQLSEFQVKYEKEKDQAQILKLEKENLQKTNQRNAYMFTGLGIIALALFTILFFRQKAKHVKIMTEQKIRQLEEEKKVMAAKLIVEGQEEERKRIATELHDGLGVLLSATKMQFSVIKDKSPENRELIEKATHMLEQASGDVRKISHNMMPGLLTKLGFFEAVEDLFDHLGDTQDLQASFEITGEKERFGENKEIMLYRIVQELVNNTLKHAHAKNIRLQVTVNPGNLDLLYTDDGIGFEMQEKSGSESIGLKSIQSRVNFLNGKIDIITSPGKGVKFILQIPV